MSNPNGDLKHVVYHLYFTKSMRTTHNGNKIIILVHQRQKRVSGLMMMVMVKVDDDHDNDEGGFGIGRVVRISQVYQLRICLGRIPIQPPSHILSFHPTHQEHAFIKSMLCFTLPKLFYISTLVSFHPTNHVMPGNCIMVSKMFRLWLESFQVKPTHS